ncbi:MAG: GTP 3',8-cyclase MoaA [Eubacteriales bacterium]|nr:GTP 3',8-cyclase MoaA [Eubacteriales bacterium]
MQDPKGRTISYLRLSVTELCNLRCRYCMPPEGVVKRRHEDMLTQEEMLCAVRAAASLGVYKVRVTGGEPLVKKNILSICRGIREVEGIRELCLTTNGILLPQMAEDLREAGVDRINLSLDTLDADRYRLITRGGELQDALRGLKTALRTGFDRIKINAVLLPDTGTEEVQKLASLTMQYPVDVRFIEMMPMPGNDGARGQSFIPASKVLDALPAAEPLEQSEMKSWDRGTVARLYRLPGSRGNIGLISPLSAHFCASCSRLRLTADGHIRPCLHDSREYRIKGCTFEEMREMFIASINNKPAGNPMIFGEDRAGAEMTGKVFSTGGGIATAGRSMNRIGG